MRHLINCSSEEAYNASIAKLRRTLSARGYPQQIMPGIEYDPVKREGILTRLRAREFDVPADLSADESRPRRMVFKCEYGAYLKPLRLQKELTKLTQQLKVILGNAFLQDIRTLIAHPVSTNLFRSVHQHNFVLPHLQKNGSWGRVGGLTMMSSQ